MKIKVMLNNGDAHEVEANYCGWDHDSLWFRDQQSENIPKAMFAKSAVVSVIAISPPESA